MRWPQLLVLQGILLVFCLFWPTTGPLTFARTESENAERNRPPEPVQGMFNPVTPTLIPVDDPDGRRLDFHLLTEARQVEAKGAEQQALDSYQLAQGGFLRPRRTEALCLVWERLSQVAFRLKKYDLVFSYLTQLMDSRRKSGPPEALPPALEEFGALYRLFGKWERAAFTIQGEPR